MVPENGDHKKRLHTQHSEWMGDSLEDPVAHFGPQGSLWNKEVPENHPALRLEGYPKTVMSISPFCREKNEHIAVQTSWKDLMWYLFQV